jgi:predicted transcriptional regulator
MARWTVEDLHKTRWFAPLLEQVERALDGLSAERQNARPALEKECAQLGQQIQGWSLSLAKPELNQAVRAIIENDLERALRRQQEIEGQLAEVDALRRRAGSVVDAEQVVDRLNRLADVLTTQNPSRTNLELSLHIEAIRCYQDGRVVVRTCKLGALAGSTDLLAQSQDIPAESTPGNGATMVAKPRRRAVRRVAAKDGEQAELQAAAHQAADVDRFAGLGPEWFWEDSLEIQAKQSWAEAHALEVAQKRAAGMTLEQLAAHFGKTFPTIRKALGKAVAAGFPIEELPRKLRRRCWAEDHAAEVVQLKLQGMGTLAIARHLGKSEPTIRAALEHAQRQAQATRQLETQDDTTNTST